MEQRDKQSRGHGGRKQLRGEVATGESLNLAAITVWWWQVANQVRWGSWRRRRFPSDAGTGSKAALLPWYVVPGGPTSSTLQGKEYSQRFRYPGELTTQAGHVCWVGERAKFCGNFQYCYFSIACLCEYCVNIPICNNRFWFQILFSRVPDN